MAPASHSARPATCCASHRARYASPDEIHNRPVNTFVAGFIGSPAMNLLRGRVTSADSEAAIAGEDGWVLPLAPALGRHALTSSGQVIVGVRHGHVRLAREAAPGWMAARVYTVEPTGDLTYVHVRLGEHQLVASASPEFRAAPDAPIWLTFDQDHLHRFDAETEQLLEGDGPPAQTGARREAAAV